MTDHQKILDDVSANIIGAPLQPKAQGAFEAADRFDHTLAMWAPPLRSADLDVLEAKETADSRVRDMFRNDGYVNSGAEVHKDSVVGDFFRFSSKPNLKILGLEDDREWARDFAEEVEAKFTMWADSPEGYVDSAGMMNLTEIVRLSVATTLLTGEWLHLFDWQPDAPGTYATRIMPIDTDRLRTPFEHIGSDRVRGGVRLSRTGRHLGYYIWKQHPSENLWQRAHGGRDWKYVRADTSWGRRRVFYYRDVHRPEQTRGISQLVSALKEMRLLKTYRGLELQKAAVAATFAAVIESDMPTPEALAAIGAKTGDQNAYIAAAQEYLSAVGRYVNNAGNIQVDGVKIPHLFPGTKLHIEPASKAGGGIGQDFERSLIRHMAAVFGMSEEEFSRDFSKTNYSSARAAMLQTWRHFRARKKFVAERVAASILRAWFEEAANKPLSRGGLESLRYRKAPNIYKPMMLDAYTAGYWMGAPRGQIDELRETQAMILRIKTGVSTLEKEMRERGHDWQEVLEQRAREEEKMEELGLTYGEAESINAASGSVREMKDEDGGLKTPEMVKEVEEEDNGKG